MELTEEDSTLLLVRFQTVFLRLQIRGFMPQSVHDGIANTRDFYYYLIMKKAPRICMEQLVTKAKYTCSSVKIFIQNY